MALAIDTFNNATGGQAFFKAIGHPAAAERATKLLARLAGAGPVAIYDPNGLAAAFNEIHPLGGLDIAGIFVQAVEHLGTTLLGHQAQPVTDLPSRPAKVVLIVAFDSGRLADHIRHLLPAGAELVSLDEMRLPDRFLTNPGRYLDPLNFATNFAFFRDQDGDRTTVVTVNYWSGYGAKNVRLWCRLIGGDGSTLAEWEQLLTDSLCGVSIDSREVRERFGLNGFCGQLFIQAIGARGHDVVKYALDTWGDTPDRLSCTHDANAWPSDIYAGLPAPQGGEEVVLWLQNSHPCPIPAGGVGLNLMGHEDVAWLDREIPPFATYALNSRELLPDAAWPAQIEVQAGKYFVRPRYEIANAAGRRRIAHVNVERTDLAPDPKIPEISNLLGKGYVLPAPVLPSDRFSSAMLPTPMATCQANLPVALRIYDGAGKETHVHRFGCLARSDSEWLSLDQTLAANGGLPTGYGHMELLYDFAEGGEADGWLHAIFRYEDRQCGHIAETSFGAHIFNTVLTYNREPQSYAGPAPGLSTRLFLRLGTPPLDTMCHLIYSVATEWHGASDTSLALFAGDGQELASEQVHIPANGSLHWRAGDVFGQEKIAAGGPGAYVVVRDTTCRLFGYHGLLGVDGAFSFDHMFGF